MFNVTTLTGKAAHSLASRLRLGAGAERGLESALRNSAAALIERGLGRLLVAYLPRAIYAYGGLALSRLLLTPSVASFVLALALALGLELFGF